MTEYKLFESEIDLKKLHTKVIKQSIAEIDHKIDELTKRKRILINELLMRNDLNNKINNGGY